MSYLGFSTFQRGGQIYVRCLRCKRIGRSGWAHACGSNWYTSVRALEDALEKSVKEVADYEVRVK